MKMLILHVSFITEFENIYEWDDENNKSECEWNYFVRRLILKE